MGLENKKSEGVTYVNTYQESFTIPALADAEGAEKRIIGQGTKAGQEKWEYRYNALSGGLVGFQVKKDIEYPQLQIDLLDKGTTYRLCLSLHSSFAFSFYNRMENLDWSTGATFRIWHFEATAEEKAKNVMSIYQNGEKVEGRYTMEEIPRWVPIDMGMGKKGFNKDDAYAFFEKKFTKVQSDIGQYGQTAKKNAVPTEEPLSEESLKSGATIGESDDLPF